MFSFLTGNNCSFPPVQFALDQVNALDEASCYLAYTYIRVLKAYRQLVAGYNFGFEIEVLFFMKRKFTPQLTELSSPPFFPILSHSLPFSLFLPLSPPFQVNTTMKGLCHVHYSEGLEILKNLVVYQDFAGNRQLTQPENKESLVFEKETLSEGQDCTPTGDEGCKSDFICIGNETAVCQASTLF